MQNNMSNKPTFSIVTCTWNSAATLADTLASVQRQTCQDVEHIFVDGGSTDGTLDMIAAYPCRKRVLRDVAAVNARGPEKDHGVLDVLQLEAALRLQVLGEDADRTGILAFQERVIQVSLRLRTHDPIICSHDEGAQ